MPAIEGHHASTLPRLPSYLLGPQCPELGRLVRNVSENPQVCLWAPAVSQAGLSEGRLYGQVALGVATGKYPDPGIQKLGSYPGSVIDLLGVLDQSPSPL